MERWGFQVKMGELQGGNVAIGSLFIHTLTDGQPELRPTSGQMNENNDEYFFFFEQRPREATSPAQD